jgi:hypothetical protein
MPYIKEYKRALFEDFGTNGIENCGDLNYLFTKLCIKYMEEHGLSYQTCNDIVGALDNAKDEFRRRIQHPYEDTKIEANSDVYNIK